MCRMLEGFKAVVSAKWDGELLGFWRAASDRVFLAALRD